MLQYWQLATGKQLTSTNISLHLELCPPVLDSLSFQPCFGVHQSLSGQFVLHIAS